MRGSDACGLATVYGLDDGRRVRTSFLVRADGERLGEIARQALQEHAAVEVWRGGVCALRLSR